MPVMRGGASCGARFAQDRPQPLGAFPARKAICASGAARRSSSGRAGERCGEQQIFAAPPQLGRAAARVVGKVDEVADPRRQARPGRGSARRDRPRRGSGDGRPGHSAPPPRLEPVDTARPGHGRRSARPRRQVGEIGIARRAGRRNGCESARLVPRAARQGGRSRCTIPHAPRLPHRAHRSPAGYRRPY